MTSVDDARAALASPRGALTLATISFTLSFAAWGLIGGLASFYRYLERLDRTRSATL